LRRDGDDDPGKRTGGARRNTAIDPITSHPGSQFMSTTPYTRRAFLGAAAAAAAAAATVRAQAPAKGAPVTITYWTILDPKTPGPRSAAQTQIIDSFMQANPDIKVEVVAMNYARINPMLIQSGAAGNGPDVVKVFQPWLTQPVEAGTLLPLNDLLAKWTDAQRKDFIFPLSTTTYNNNVYSLLHELRTDLFWYRKDVLAKAGIAVPKTWDEVGIAAGKLNADRQIGYGVGASSQQGAAAIAEWFHPMIWGAGGELFDDKGMATINSPAGVRALQWIKDLVHKYKGAPTSIANITTEGQLDGMKSGTIVMTTDQSTRVSTARAGEGIGANLATGPIPGFEAGKPGPTGSSGWTLGIGKSTKNREASWKFIEHYVSARAQMIDAKVSSSLPCRTSVYKDPFFASGDGVEMKSWADYMTQHGRMPKLPENYPRLLEFEAIAIQKVVLNSEDPKKALDEAVKSYNATVKKS
jgi:ABC-type glycerol-3-phosphate transport system substrate-binding protein